MRPTWLHVMTASSVGLTLAMCRAIALTQPVDVKPRSKRWRNRVEKTTRQAAPTAQAIAPQTPPMTSATRKKPGPPPGTGGRPRLYSERIVLAIPRNQVTELDAWRLNQPKPHPNRPAAIRRLLDFALSNSTAKQRPQPPLRPSAYARKATSNPDGPLGVEHDPATRASLHRLLLEEWNNLGFNLGQLGGLQRTVIEGRARIAIQIAVVETLSAEGQDVRLAKAELDKLIEIQNVVEQCRQVIVDAVDQNEGCALPLSKEMQAGTAG
jgi:hypothetical protein